MAYSRPITCSHRSDVPAVTNDLLLIDADAAPSNWLRAVAYSWSMMIHAMAVMYSITLSCISRHFF